MSTRPRGTELSGSQLAGGVASLSSDFVLEAGERLREDEVERARPAGPEVKLAQAKKTTYVH